MIQPEPNHDPTETQSQSDRNPVAIQPGRDRIVVGFYLDRDHNFDDNSDRNSVEFRPQLGHNLPMIGWCKRSTGFKGVGYSVDDGQHEEIG